MANKYPVVAGGNWNTDATWTLNSDGTPNATTKPSASDAVFMNATSGNVTIDATATALSLDCTGYTGTLTHNSGITLTISGSVTMVAGMTYTPAETSVIAFNTTDLTFTSGGKTPSRLQISGTNVDVTLGDNLTFGAFKTCSFTLASTGTTIILNGFTLSGNSSTNRVLVTSGTLGSSRTVTNTTGTFANADFRDITFSTNADYSAITGGSGDCGGNTNATFTTAATQTYTGGTGSWSDVTKWTSRVPLPQDNVSMSGVTGGTITADMPRLGKSIDWTGATNSPTWTGSVATTNYGSITLISGMSIGGSSGHTNEGRGSYTLTTAGKSLFNGSFTYSGVGGTMNLQDAISSSTQAFSVTDGTFNTNGFSTTTLSFRADTSTRTRAVNISSSTVTVTGTGTTWNYGTTTGLTFTSTGSTIILSDTGASSKTFAGGGLTYNDLKIAGGGAGAVIISGSNSFNRLPQIAGGTKTLQITAGTTQTFRSVGVEGFGNGSNVITIQSTSGGSTYTFSRASGIVSADYISLQDSIATGGAEWYAGANSTNVSGNTGWYFTVPQFVASENLTKAGTSWVWGLDPNSYAYGALLQQEWVPSSSNATIGNNGLLTSAHLRQTYGNLTFFKDYASASSSVDADFAAGSGTGTFTVTRSATTPATTIDSTGRIQIVQHTGPRFTAGFYNSTGFVSRPGLIVEGASTNMLKDSYFADGTITTNWRASGGDAAISRDSTTITNVYSAATVTGKMTATLANSLFITAVANKPTLAASTVYTISAILSGSGTVNLYGSTNNGSVGNWSSNITLSSTPKLYTLTITQAGSPFGENVGVGLQNNSTVSCNVHYFQIEALPFASTFIPTTTAALTRNAETLTYPIASNRTAATESIFVKHTTPFNNTQNASLYYLTVTDTKSRALFYSASGDDIGFAPNITDNALVLIRSGVATGKPVAGTAQVITGVAYGPTGNPNSAFYIDGVSYDSSTNANTDWTTPAWGTNFYLGTDGSGVGFGIISSIAIFSDAKSAADVASITRTLQ